jgi:hypothetical protein
MLNLMRKGTTVEQNAQAIKRSRHICGHFFGYWLPH